MPDVRAPCCSCTVESLNMRLSGEATVVEVLQPCTTLLLCLIGRPWAAGYSCISNSTGVALDPLKPAPNCSPDPNLSPKQAGVRLMQ